MALSRTVRRKKGSELGEHRPRVLEDVAVGVAAEVIAARMGLALAAAVLLQAWREW